MEFLESDVPSKFTKAVMSSNSMVSRCLNMIMMMSLALLSNTCPFFSWASLVQELECEILSKFYTACLVNEAFQTDAKVTHHSSIRFLATFTEREWKDTINLQKIKDAQMISLLVYHQKRLENSLTAIFA